MFNLTPISYRVERCADTNARKYIISPVSALGLLTDLDDALYIEEELTPTHRSWREELRAYGVTSFDYHGCEPVTVSATETANEFLVY